MTLTNYYEFDLLLSALKNADSILLFTHVSPDGDTLGSALALKARLQRIGKKASVLVNPPIREKMRILPGIGEVITSADDIPKADMYIAVDVASKGRLGECFLPVWEKADETWLIDHHASNEHYTTHLMLEKEAPATGILVYRLLQAMNIPFSQEEAICLYTAVSTDTGNFIYDATTSECFEMMSSLMRDTGMKLGETARIVHREKEPAFIRLLSCVLPKMSVSSDGKVAGYALSLDEIHNCQASQAECEGLIDYAIDMRGVEMAYFIYETETGKVKCSLRSKVPFSVRKVAENFGGGGHEQAAGCTFEGKITLIQNEIENALQKELEFCD